MQRDFSVTPPFEILQVMLEAVLHAGTNQDIGLGYQEIGVDKKREKRVEYLLKPGSIKEGRLEEKLKIDVQKVDGSRALVEMWDRREWAYR